MQDDPYQNEAEVIKGDTVISREANNSLHNSKDLHKEANNLPNSKVVRPLSNKDLHRVDTLDSSPGGKSRSIRNQYLSG